MKIKNQKHALQAFALAVIAALVALYFKDVNTTGMDLYETKGAHWSYLITSSTSLVFAVIALLAFVFTAIRERLNAWQ